MSDIKVEQEDSELIECYICKRVLNGMSFWVVSDLGLETIEPMAICEICRESIRQQIKEQ